MADDLLLPTRKQQIYEKSDTLLPPQTEREETTTLLPPTGSSLVPKDQPEQSFSDVTSGAFQYGAASTGEALARVAHLHDMAQSLQDFKDSHPQYAPQRVDSTFQLLTSPGKLASQISSGAPQLLTTLGLMAIPYAGIPLSAGLNGVIEYENTKEDALQRGVNSRDAEKAAWSSGIVSAAIQLIPETQMFRYATGGQNSVAKSVYQATLREALASDLPQEAAMEIARKQMGEYLGKEISPVLAAEMMKGAPGISGAIAGKLSFGNQAVEDAVAPVLAMGGYGAVGGAATESIKRQFYGKDIKEPLPDFNWGSWLDSRAQEFLTGAGTAAFVGVPLHMVSQRIAQNKLTGHLPDFTAIKDDLISKDQFYDSFLNKMSPEQRAIAEPMFDRIWQTAAEANGMTTREKALKTWMTLSKQGENVDVGPLAQESGAVGGFFSKLDQFVNSPQFEKMIGNGKSGMQLKAMLEKPQTGITSEELKWTGVRDALEYLGGNMWTKEDIQQLVDTNLVQVSRQIQSSEKSKQLEQEYQQLKKQEDIHKKNLIDVANEHQSLVSKGTSADVDEAAIQQSYKNVENLSGQLVAHQNVMKEHRNQMLSARDLHPNHPDIAPSGLKDNFTEILVRWPSGPGYTDSHYPAVKDYLMDISLGAGYVKDAETGEAKPVMGIIESQSNRQQDNKKQGGIDYTVLDPKGRLVGGPFPKAEYAEQFKNTLDSGNTRGYVVQSKDSELAGPFMSKAADQVRHGFKQALLYAVERGYDRIALPDPEQVADRWHSRGEPEWQGLHDFYDKIHNTSAEKLMRQYDPQYPGAKEMELVGGEPQTVIKNEKGERVGTDSTDPARHIASNQDELPEGWVSLEEPRKLKVLEITPAVRERVMLGQPLFQKESLKALLDRVQSGSGPYLTMAPPNALLKAAMDKFGGIHTGDFQDHSQILQAAWSKEGLMPRDFQSVGYLTKGENEGLQYVPKRQGLELYLARTLRDDTVPVGQKDVVLHSPTEYLAQGINGSTTFLRQANGLVKALVSMNDPANFSTAFHELAHVLTYFSSPDERAALEKFVKRDYDHWGTAEWEKVARSFEAYVQKGSSPSPALQPFFEAASEHMVKVYGALRDSTLAKQLSPEALQAFDNWVVKDTPEVAQARVNQATMDAAYAQIEDIKHLAYRSPVYTQLLEQAEGNIKNAQIQLQAERNSRLSREPEVSKRADLNNVIEEARSSATPASLGMARVLEKFAFSALTPFSLERSLGTNAYAIKHVELANAALARMNMISQPLKAEAEDMLSSVHPKVFRELEQLEPVSEHALIAKGTRLLDRSSMFATPIEPGSAHEVVAQAFYKARYTLLKMMEDIGGWRLFSGGAREPVKAGEYDINNLRKNRIFDRDFRDRWQVDAEFQKSVVAAYSEVNPEMNAKDIFSFMDGLVHNTDIRKSSSLEFGRTFPNAPDAVMHDGKIVPVLEIGVRDLLARSINSEASRIAVIEKYGQSGLEKANISDWSRFAHILDLDQSFTADMLRSRLNEATGDDGSPRVDPTVTQGMNYSQLRKMAKTLEVPAGLTQEDFVRMTDKVRAADILNVDASVNQIKQKQLTKLAKQLGGITLQQPFADLMNEVRLRLKELPVDVYDQLKKGYVDTGGQNVKGFEELWQRMQGINPSGPQSPWMKVMNAIKSPIGILHMFGQAPLWVTQISNFLPKAGLINFLGGVQDFFRNPELTRAQATALGTLASAGESLKREYGVNSLGRWMSEKVYALSGMSRVDDFISLVGTNIGIRLAESWNNNGMQTKDIGLAKALRLSEADMQMLREHKMTDELKGKIAQNFVDRGGGFYNASGVKRGALENTPLGRLFFSYGTYANSMARYGMDFMTEARSASEYLKKGDVKPVLQATWKLALLTGTIAGMYPLGKILRGALTGTLHKQPDETLGEKGLHAVLDFGLLGPAQRLMTGMMYDGGDTSKILTAMSPQLVAIGDMFASLLNNKYMPQGRYANYDWWDRLWITARDNVPFAGAMKNFYEQALFPDKPQYDKTRSEVVAYSKRHNLALGVAKADQAFSFENPYTHGLVTAMERMDFEGAKDLVQKYYDVEIPRLSQEEWIKEGLTYETMQEKLRSTLLAHSPLREVDGNAYMLSDFLSKHDKDFAGTMLLTDAKYKAMVNAFAPSQKR